MFYYEVDILVAPVQSDQYDDASISIGVTLNAMPTVSNPLGFQAQGWGYNGANERIYSGSESSDNNGPRYPPLLNNNKKHIKYIITYIK